LRALGDQGDEGCCSSRRLNLKVIAAPARRRQYRLAAATSARAIVVMNTPYGNRSPPPSTAIALMFALARQLSRRRPLDAIAARGRSRASWGFGGSPKTLRRHRLRQYRLDRRNRAHRPAHEGRRLLSVPLGERAGALGFDKVDSTRSSPVDFITLHSAAY